MARAAELCEGSLAALSLWSRPSALVAVRAGNPLHWSAAAEGVYLAALAGGLPGTAKALPDNWVGCFRSGADGLIHHQALAIDPPAQSWSFSAAGGAYRGGLT